MQCVVRRVTVGHEAMVSLVLMASTLRSPSGLLDLPTAGRRLPARLQEFAKTRDGIRYFLTYADNAAVGYFLKQGFTKEPTLDREVVSLSTCTPMHSHMLSPGPHLGSTGVVSSLHFPSCNRLAMTTCTCRHACTMMLLGTRLLLTRARQGQQVHIQQRQ